MSKILYNWTDNPTVSGVSICDTDILNDCLMHLKYDNNGSGFNLFDTKISDHILSYEESEGWALQGSYVYKEAVAGSRYGYPDFYNKCLEEYQNATNTETINEITIKVNSNGHKFYDIADKTAIDTFFNSTGTAWFYGIDTENERIFLPRNNWFEQMTGDPNTVNKFIEAGLPNITGSFRITGSTVAGSNIHTTAGCFYSSDSANTANSDTFKTVSGTITGNIDASRSSNIYGNSVTVQPKSIKKLLYICVGNSTNYQGITNVVNQGMDILEQVHVGLETKANKTDIDGQWVKKDYSLSTATAVGTYTLDLSQVIPNDGYCYEVFLRVSGICSSASANAGVAVSSLQSSLAIAGGIYSNSSVWNNNDFSMPVGSDRVLTLIISQTAFTAHRVWIGAYRRLGSNQ